MRADVTGNVELLDAFWNFETDKISRMSFPQYSPMPTFWRHVTAATSKPRGWSTNYPTEAAARKSDTVPSDHSADQCRAYPRPVTTSTVGALIARYENEELPARCSTLEWYKFHLDNYIRPRWGQMPIASVTAMAVDDWLKYLKLASKTRVHIRSSM